MRPANGIKEFVVPCFVIGFTAFNAMRSCNRFKEPSGLDGFIGRTELIVMRPFRGPESFIGLSGLTGMGGFVALSWLNALRPHTSIRELDALCGLRLFNGRAARRPYKTVAVHDAAPSEGKDTRCFVTDMGCDVLIENRHA